jgi:hypothetical protein
MKAYPKPPKRKVPAAAPRLYGDIARGEAIELAIYLPGRKLLHRFTAVALGASNSAIKFVATHGPANAGREQFFWVPKSWRMAPVPRSEGLHFLPIQKAKEIGIPLVLTFNQIV